MSDVKALIADAQSVLAEGGKVPASLVMLLVDALEASVQAPANNAVLHQCPVTREVNDMNGYCSTCQEVHRAFSASVQAPAVDREALANALGVALANAYDDDSVVTVEESVTVQLFASGILLDAAEVEARGLEKAARDVLRDATLRGDFVQLASSWLARRAQQVREGSADSKAGAATGMRETMRQVAQSDEKLAEAYRKARGGEGN